MTDIEECLISMDGTIQDLLAFMSVDETERFKERLIRDNLNILIAISKQAPELKPYFNNKQANQEGDHSSEQ